MSEQVQKRKRAVVSNEDFVRVVIVEHTRYPTIASAAKALGMEITSFRQRMTRSRKEHPSLPWPSYRGNSGPRKATTESLQAILTNLQGNG